VWQYAKQLEDYHNSPFYGKHIRFLSSLCVEGSPLEHHSWRDRGYWPREVTPYTSITEYYFPADLSAENREVAEESKGLRTWLVPRYDNPYIDTSDTRSWSVPGPDSTFHYKGQEVIVLRIFDFWKLPNSEATYKRDFHDFYSDGNGSAYLVNAYDEHKRVLESLGMIGLRRLQPAFRPAPSFRWHNHEENWADYVPHDDESEQDEESAEDMRADEDSKSKD